MNDMSAPPVGTGISRDDVDRAETQEWREAFEATISAHGRERGRFLIGALLQDARRYGLDDIKPLQPSYRNTISPEHEPDFPGDFAIEERIAAIVRWNALAMVVRANGAYGELGGHIASFASAAEIFETGFNHFFRGADAPGGGDLVFFQPHSAPGIYARAFLEGRLSEEELGRYRREAGGAGLSSYPHPWLMPDFWQVPTGSMGIGPLCAIYQARFMRYLRDRGLADTDARRVWGIFGDGEMDEPEAVGALTLAARERLDNLTFVVNCNLQRLDGPVRGNGQIVSELEALFEGAGWNVIKVLWGSDWDALFARDTEGVLERKLGTTVDGKFQALGARDAAYNLSKFFNEDAALSRLVETMSADQIDGLKRGGHDMRKLYAAFQAAQVHSGRPTVILVKTKKGFGMGHAGESRMTAHQAKKLDIDSLHGFRDRFDLPIPDDVLETLPFYRPPEDSPEIVYLKERRAALGGPLPRRVDGSPALHIPALLSYAAFALDPAGKEMSTTMAAVRMLGNLLKDDSIGARIVPIVADEARTFGMASLFRQVGIYAPAGQLYEPEDAGSMLFYREAKDGQILEEGITEAGALASWIAAGSAYALHGVPMLPFYIFYSMFGFQRVGDIIWAAADQRTRGFLFGATAGRTTLAGEGLQHQDGHSHVVAATVPNCRAYDPAFASEFAVILDHGMREMFERREDVFYYVTLTNENYVQRALPEGAEIDVVKGMYRIETGGPDGAAMKVGPIRLLGSGSILPEVIEAARLLEADWDIASEVWSVTSFSELAREAREVERFNRLRVGRPVRHSHLANCLEGTRPVVAVTDYVRAYPQLVAPYLDAPFVALGTDGFGRSDTRKALRRFFEIDRYHIVVAALDALAKEKVCDQKLVAEAIHRYGIEADIQAPWQR